METDVLESFFSNQWNATIRRFQESASWEPDDLDEVYKLKSWPAVQAAVFGVDTAARSDPHIALIQPAMGHLSVFENFFEGGLGPQLDPSFFWGVTGFLLKVSAEDESALGRIPRMIKSFAHKAEGFNSLLKSTPTVSNQMKEACFDMQMVFMHFLEEAIKCIRGEDNKTHRGSRSARMENPWSVLEQKYTSSIQGLSETLARVEQLTQSGPSVLPHTLPAAEVKALAQRLQCLMLPQGKASRFFNRVDIFEQLDTLLKPESTDFFLSVALYGLGGVGKSTIASTYIERRYNEGVYDTVLWVRGEKPSEMRQSFTEIALRLKLPGAKASSHDENLLLVQEWMQSTDSKWLVVYDNVESADHLTEVWPTSSRGKAIITTRNHSLAFKPAAYGLEVQSWSSKTGSEFLMFLLDQFNPRNSEEEAKSALVISEKLDGHPLAISHMAGLIHRRAWSVQEFADIYLRSPQRAHNELTNLFEFSFRSLDIDSLHLLGVLSFLMPDAIPADMFKADTNHEVPEVLKFCEDDYSLSETVEALLALALITRDRKTRVFSIHRLVQTHFRFFMSSEQLQESFDDTALLLYNLFPKEDESSGQLYDAWSACNQYLPHVLNLKDAFNEEKRRSKAFRGTWKFCDLLSNCQTYLSEAHLFEELESVCDANLLALSTMELGPERTNLTASILSHQANKADAEGNAEKAISLNTTAYELRLGETPRKETLVAFFENNLGFNCGTANQFERSLAWFHKSRDRWLAMLEARGSTPVWPAYMRANTARSMVYVGDLSGARALLSKALAELESHKVLNWAWLANAYFVQGTLERRDLNLEAAEASFMQAQNCWLRGDQKRLHPFNSGCIYNIGVCCLEQGKIEAAIKHFGDSIYITQYHSKRLPAEHARNLFKLSEALTQDRDSLDGEEHSKAQDLRNEAEIFLKRKCPQATSFDSELSYNQFIYFMHR